MTDTVDFLLSIPMGRTPDGQPVMCDFTWYQNLLAIRDAALSPVTQVLSITGATPIGFDDSPGAELQTLDITTAGGGVLLIFGGQLTHDNVLVVDATTEADFVTVTLKRDGLLLDTFRTGQLIWQEFSSTLSFIGAVAVQYFDTPDAGEHTYSVEAVTEKATSLGAVSNRTLTLLEFRRLA